VYKDIRKRVHQVYVATLKCDRCVWDGAVRHLQLEVVAGTKAMRTGQDIRLAAWEPRVAQMRDPPLTSPQPGESIPAHGTGVRSTPQTGEYKPAAITWWPPPDLRLWGYRIPWWLYSGILGVLLLLSVLLIFLLKSDHKPTGAQPQPALRPGSQSLAQDMPMPEKTFAPTGAATTVALGGTAAKSPSAAPGLKGRLTFIRSEAARKPLEFTLTGTLTLGRAKPPADLAFPGDQEISRQHCQLLLEDGAVKIMDLGSKNGTLVNGVPITGKYRVQHDDIIRIGRTELRLSLE